MSTDDLHTVFLNEECYVLKLGTGEAGRRDRTEIERRGGSPYRVRDTKGRNRGALARRGRSHTGMPGDTSQGGRQHYVPWQQWQELLGTGGIHWA